MSERWAVDMVEAIRGKSNNPQNNEIMFATIKSVNPLSLLINDQIITKNIFTNSAFMLEADDYIDKIEIAFENAPTPQSLFNFLKNYHKRFVLKKGDSVIVIMSGYSFYILQKVVKIR